MSICYDLRFPELYRRLIDGGAELLLNVASWPAARLEAWLLFCRARAHENLAFMLACNAAGSHRGVSLAGHSQVVDPTGRVVAEAGDGEQLLTVEIDPTAAARLRSEFPALSDRKLK